MDIIDDNSFPTVTSVFTDRTKPREAFWRKFEEAAKAQAEKKKKGYVLSYYGVGGIGKTALLQKLKEEITEKHSAPLYADWDFGEAQDCRTVLCCIKKQLQKQGFKFPLFDFACYFYAYKIGDNAKSPEIEKIIGGSSILGLCSTIAGMIPCVSFWTKLITTLDQALVWVRNYMQNHTASVKEMEKMDASELKEKLPFFFAKDLAANMETQNQPLVIFLDTYEKLVNELAVDDPLSNDLWLRGIMGVIRRVPYVLWVIAGREKLKWEMLDAAWQGGIEQHLLGNLSEQDSLYLLKSAGITDEELQAELYRLTDGVPIYLDICITQYIYILQNGELPKKEDFGYGTEALHADTTANALTGRFLDHIKDSIQKDILFMLACVEWWDDAFLAELAISGNCNFSDSAYEIIKKMSFIHADTSGNFRLHQTIGEILSQQCPRGIKEKVAHGLMRMYQNVSITKNNVFDDTSQDALKRILQAGLLMHETDEALRLFYKEQLYEKLVNLAEFGQWEKALMIMAPLLLRAGQKKDSLFYTEVCCDAFWLGTLVAVYGSPDPTSDQQANLYQTIATGAYLEILEDMTYVAMDYMQKGEHHRAIKIQQLVLARYQRSLGAYDTKTISAMYYLARSMQHIENWEEAVGLHKAIVETAAAGLGKDHPRTMVATSELADILCLVGKADEACPLYEITSTYYAYKLGKEHEETGAEIKKRIACLKKTDAQKNANLIETLKKEYRIDA